MTKASERAAPGKASKCWMTASGLSSGRKCPPSSTVAIFAPGTICFIMFPFVGPRPIAIAPEQQHGNSDVRIGHGRRFPGFGVAEQIEEGAVMAFAVADEIHFLEQLRRNAPRVGDAAVQALIS